MVSYHSQAQTVKALLQLEPHERSKSDIILLTEFFKNNAFFARETERARDIQTIQNLYTHLRLQESRAGSTVFKFGDRGQLFYIIIDGEVEIRTPSPVELEND